MHWPLARVNALMPSAKFAKIVLGYVMPRAWGSVGLERGEGVRLWQGSGISPRKPEPMISCALIFVQRDVSYQAMLEETLIRGCLAPQ